VSIDGHAKYCPRCGEPLSGSGDSSRGFRYTNLASLVAILVGLALVLLIVGSVAAGLRERSLRTVISAQRHYEAGVVFMENGRYDLAERELRTALRMEPSLTDAQAKLDELAQLQATPTADAAVPTEVPNESAKDALARIRRAYQAGDYEQVTLLVISFRGAYPDEQSSELNEMQLASYRALAEAALAEDHMSDAVRHFDNALLLAPSDVELATARQMAVLYVDAGRYWGGDWSSTIAILEHLVAQDPEYKDVYTLLYNAHLNYGNEAVTAGESCLAAEQYQAAYNLAPSDEVGGLQAAAANACLSSAVESELLVAGDFVGAVISVQPAGNADFIYIYGYVLNSASKGLSGMRVRISAWDWSAVATTDSAGLFSFDGLATPATYILELLDSDAPPLEVPAELGQSVQVNFQALAAAE